MNRRPRQPLQTIETLDVQIINTKIQLHGSLVSASIDYDHYRAGEIPHTSVVFSQPWLTLAEVFSDISPCDFIGFKSNLLAKYTSNRTDIDSSVPTYYKPHAKEERLFHRHVTTVLPAKIKEFQELKERPKDSRFLDKDFYLDYETVLKTRFNQNKKA